MPSLILQAAQSLSRTEKLVDEQTCYLGYTVTKKIGKAHLRNRTKRRLRAAAASAFAQYAQGGIDYVLIGRYNTADVEFPKLCSHVQKAIISINQMLLANKGKPHEKPDAAVD